MKFVYGSLPTLLNAHKPKASSNAADVALSSKAFFGSTVDQRLHKNYVINKRNSFAPNNSFGLQADLGILSSHTRNIPTSQHRRMEFLETCPTNCTNEALCNCMTDYDKANEEGQETCAYAIAKSCENPEEMKSCTPDEYYLAASNYFYCPLFTCLKTQGIGLNNNDTEAYFKCQCEAQTNLCDECSRVESPYCYYFMSAYNELCAEIIPCCTRETTIEGLQTCRDIWCDCDDIGTGVTASIADIANELSPSEAIKEESCGPEYGWKQATAAALALFWFV